MALSCSSYIWRRRLSRVNRCVDRWEVELDSNAASVCHFRFFEQSNTFTLRFHELGRNASPQHFTKEKRMPNAHHIRSIRESYSTEPIRHAMVERFRASIGLALN